MATTFGSAGFKALKGTFSQRRGLVPEVRVGVRFTGATQADALAALITPRDCYSLRATLDGTPILQRWGGGGIHALTVDGFLTAENALLVDLEENLWLPGGVRHGTGTFLLTATAVEP